MSFRLGFEYASTSFSIGGPFRRPNGSLQSDLFVCQNGYPKTIAFGHPSRPGGRAVSASERVPPERSFWVSKWVPQNNHFRTPPSPGGAPPWKQGSRKHGKLDDSSTFLRHFPAGEAGAGTLPNIMRDLGSPPGGSLSEWFLMVKGTPEKRYPGDHPDRPGGHDRGNTVPGAS